MKVGTTFQSVKKKKKSTEPMTHDKAKHSKQGAPILKEEWMQVVYVYYIHTWGHKELDMT